MWLTLILALDVFLAWWLTSLIISLTCRVIPFLDIARSILETFHLPPGFITLVLFLPNLLLLGLYLMWSLPQSNAFKAWSGWEGFRRNMYSHGVSVHTNQVIYAICPHGMHGEATIAWFVLNRLYLDVVPIATSLLFWIPIVREFAALAGAVPAKTAVISRLLDEGKSILLLPEGIRGALYPEKPLAVLQGFTEGESDPRKGFIRLALTNKNHRTLKIVPVWMEGVEKMYSRILFTHPFQGWLQRILLKNWLYPWPLLIWGHRLLGFWPRTDSPLHIFFGEPISLVTPGGASREVDQVFAEYVEAMKGLCAKGSTYNPGSVQSRP